MHAKSVTSEDYTMDSSKWSLFSSEDKEKVVALKNPKVESVLALSIELMLPKNCLVFNDSLEDRSRIRELAISSGEEKKLKMKGHTVHFDGFVTNKNHDQARDVKNSATLVEKGKELRGIVTKDRQEGLKEVFECMKGVMKEKTMVVRFFCLGPNKSRVTDSSYVGHSEDILYRPGYRDFLEMKDKNYFFYLLHSAGELNERGNSKNLDKRRIYIDPPLNRVFSVNNQYAGNSLGLKKLCLRLAIYRANIVDKGEWLTEHMFIAGFNSPYKKDRKTYFSGAYPSACGKTSTSMIPGSSIIGDDIAYFRKGENGELRGVNIECGCFGIIRDVNKKDDPEIFRVLNSEREMIFSNILVKDGKPYWEGMGGEYPKEGENYSGEWKVGKKDANGDLIKMSHPNSRFTIRISDLENADPRLNDPNGVKVQGILYGGRDSDTCVPVCQMFDWNHGVYIGATIESESTAATIGQHGVRKCDPMANKSFVIIPLGKYFENHFKFGNSLNECPKVFSTNYFLKGNGNGKYLNQKIDKKIWILWAEGRIHGDEYASAIKTPIGFIPSYDSLKKLFMDVLKTEYKKEDYIQQFSIRTKMLLAKYERMEKVYKDEPLLPEQFWKEHNALKNAVTKLKKEKGDTISPFEF